MPESEAFFFFTLGCKINQYETQSIREAWRGQGWQETDNPEQAGVIVINTCAVTERAVQDVRKMTRRFHRINPLAKILLVGCAAQSFPHELSSLPGVWAVVPQKIKSCLLDKSCLEQCLAHTPRTKDRVFAPHEQIWPDFCVSSFSRARAVIKVQDGCSRLCSYCIVPYTRGGPKSRPLQAIWQEVQGLVASGFQELVISGINLAQYQDSQNDAMDFWDLVAWLDRMLVKHYGLQARLRLSSVDPSLMGEKALQVLEQACLVCPHVHISLQSASARILRCMGRTRTSLAALDQFLNRLAVFWPCFAFGVDLLTGFPGETDHDFQETLFFCQDLPLTYGHVFSFSPRPGTPAAQMDGQISKAVKKERSLQLRDVLARKRQGFLAELCQKDDLEMVVEQSQPCLGYCQYYTLCRLEDETSCHDKRTKIAVSPVYWTDQGLVVRRHC